MLSRWLLLVVVLVDRLLDAEKGLLDAEKGLVNRLLDAEKGLATVLGGFDPLQCLPPEIDRPSSWVRWRVETQERIETLLEGGQGAGNTTAGRPFTNGKADVPGSWLLVDARQAVQEGSCLLVYCSQSEEAHQRCGLIGKDDGIRMRLLVARAILSRGSGSDFAEVLPSGSPVLLSLLTRNHWHPGVAARRGRSYGVACGSTAHLRASEPRRCWLGYC